MLILPEFQLSEDTMPHWALLLLALAAAALLTFGMTYFLVPLVGEGTWASIVLQLTSVALVLVVALEIAWPWINKIDS